MKVLVLDEWIPFPQDSGKRIRTMNTTAALATEHEITYLCFSNPLKDRAGIKRLEDAGIKVRTVPIRALYSKKIGFTMALFGNLFSKYPFVGDKHYSAEFQKTMECIVRAENPDLIHCEWTVYGRYIRKGASQPAFLASHNVEAQPWLRVYENSKNIIKKWYCGIQWKKYFRMENELVRKFTRISAVSEEDRKLFGKWYGYYNVDVIPNGVAVAACNEFIRGRSRKQQPFSMIYVGSLDSHVNQDAVFFLVRELLPEIEKKLPGARLTIVGRNPPSAIKNLKCENVKVAGWVQDVRPYIWESMVSIVPLRVAGGSRLKILESMAMETPVVSTIIGAEGLEVKHDENILLARTSEEFISQLERLFDDKTIYRRLQAGGKTLVSEKYGWDRMAKSMETSWLRTIEDFKNAIPVSKISPFNIDLQKVSDSNIPSFHYSTRET
jgi:glycosyltransferase involved in cell wall biosynthesis